MADTVSDPQFADMALRLKILSEAQIGECRAMQAQMKSMGFPATLQEIAQRKQILAPQQLRQIQKALGIVPEQIPGYTILSKLGRGGMGVVYKARQNSVDRLVAIKVLSSLLTEDPQFVKRFMNEARAVAKLDHRHIIPVFDAGEAHGLYYFVMEYVEGKDLARIVEESGPLPEEAARRYLLQTAEALHYVHSKGMIHRDIKPENLILAKSGLLKLADFGLARTQGSAALTDPGAILGTPRFISPEQAQGVAVDIRSDLYSLGASYYFLLTGQPPYEGPTPVATALKHLNDPIPDPRAAKPEVSEASAEIVRRLMQKEPRDRFQTPADLIEAIRGRAPVPKQRSKLPWAIAAAGLLLLIPAAIYFYPDPAPPPRPPLVVQKPPPAPKPAEPDPPTPPPADSGLELMKEKRWSEAAALLKGRPEYDQCMAEIETAGLVEAIAREAEAKRWSAVESLASKFRKLRTITASERRAEVELAASRASKEIQNEAVLREAASHADAGRWTDCLNALARVEGRAEEVERIRARHGEWKRARAEAEAESLWNRAALALNDKEYRRAKGLFEDFLKEAVGTYFYASRREDAMLRIKDCDDAMSSEKERTAAELWAEAQKARSTKEFARALELIDRLDRWFESTSIYRSNTRAIAECRAACSRPQEPAAQVIDDFERGVAGWESKSDSGEKPAISESSEAREGRKSMKVQFPKQARGSDSGSVFRGIPKLAPEAASIRFWARPAHSMVGRSAAPGVLLLQQEDKGIAVFYCLFKLEAGWKEYSLPISEFKFLLKLGEASQKLDPGRVRAVGFSCAGEQTPLGVLIDGLRAEVKP
jgi:serine/threonine-protein kinase